MGKWVMIWRLTSHSDRARDWNRQHQSNAPRDLGVPSIATAEGRSIAEVRVPFYEVKALQHEKGRLM